MAEIEKTSNPTKQSELLSKNEVFQVDNITQTEAKANTNEDKIPHDQKDSSDKYLLENINISLHDFSDELKRLNALITNRLSYDDSKEKAFDQLYAELENLKRDKEFENFRPLFTDLILFYDRIKNIEEGFSNDESDLKTHFASTIESISTELVEILDRRGIRIINSSSSKFDPKIQKAIDVHSTNNEDMNNKVIKIVRSGFVYHDRILRPEEVIIEKCSVQTNNQ